MRSALGDEPLPHDVDEVGDVDVDRTVRALRVVRRLGVRRHIAARDAGRLEAGDVVVGVEVAVGGVAGIARLRRPHPVTHLQVAAEGDDIGVTDRPAKRRVAVQRRAVDHEVADTRCGVIDFHARARTRTRAPRCLSACVRSAAGRRPVPRAARTLAVAGSSSGWNGWDSGPPSSSMVPASSSSRSSGLPPCRHSVANSASARSASACSRTPNSRNAIVAAVVASTARSCQLASQWCMPDSQYGSSSCAVTTGVMPSVSR